ncbi:MAG: hypothetical protein ABR936_00480 [Bacteroidota bacterium]
MKILFFFLVTSFVADNILIWFFQRHPYRLGIIHAYFLMEYIFIISIISIWQESHWMRRIFQALILLYILFWIVAKLTFEPLSGSFSLTASISQVILSLGAGYTLFVVIGNRIQTLIHYDRFWVLLSFVIYYAGTLLFIALREILIHYSIETFFFVNSIDWSLKILFNVLFVKGFLCPQTQT